MVCHRVPVVAGHAYPDKVSNRAPVAQGIERLPPEQKVVGSNPIRGTAGPARNHHGFCQHGIHVRVTNPQGC